MEVVLEGSVEDLVDVTIIVMEASAVADLAVAALAVAALAVVALEEGDLKVRCLYTLIVFNLKRIF